MELRHILHGRERLLAGSSISLDKPSHCGSQTVSSLITIVMLGRLVEPLWGSTEFSLYLGCAVLSGGIMVWILCYVLFQSTGEAIFLYASQITCQGAREMCVAVWTIFLVSRPESVHYLSLQSWLVGIRM